MIDFFKPSSVRVVLYLKRFVRTIFSWKGMLSLIVFASLMLGAYCYRLTAIVVEKFEGPRFFLSTRIYARPLELYPGKMWRKTHLLWELEALNYQAVESVEKPGEYKDHGSFVELYTRDFHFSDGVQKGQWVRLTMVNDFVSTLQDHQSGRDLRRFRLEPIALSGSLNGDHEDRKLVSFAQLPEHLIQALIATEDQRFYSHLGVDLKALIRAFVSTVSGNGVQGGSTITQQLVKNFYLTPERTFKRKFNEMLMALILDWRYDKSEILETYLNEVYFGQDGARSIHGIQLASEFYFGRSIEQLELHQAATLIAMLKGPSYFNPRRHPQRVTNRRNLVINEMLELTFISADQADEAKGEALGIVSAATAVDVQYPALIDQVYRELETQLEDGDHAQSGLQVFTTVDPLAQDTAEKSMVEQLSRLEEKHGLPDGHLQGAVVLTDPHTGGITALVGGREVRFDGFNRALDARRQVGSLMKPVVYLAALEQPDQFHLATMLDDTALEVTLPDGIWAPQNYDKRFHGRVPMWEALAQSYNVPTVRLGLQIGLNSFIEKAHALGVTSTMAPYASAVLGAQEMTPLEVAQVYGTLAALGERTEVHAVQVVMSADGKLVLNRSPSRRVAASPQASYLMVRALQKAVNEGTGKTLERYIPQSLTIAGKTGTTDESRDSWFVGFNDQWLGVVWIGNDLNKPVALTGASGALTIWGDVFRKIGLSAYQPLQPSGVKEHHIHRRTGRRVSSRCDDAVILPFTVGSEPRKQFGCGGDRPEKGDQESWFQRIFGR